MNAQSLSGRMGRRGVVELASGAYRDERGVALITAPPRCRASGMWQLPGLPSTREDGEEKPECVCFHQKPEEENYGYVRVGGWQLFPGAPLAAAWP